MTESRNRVDTVVKVCQASVMTATKMNCKNAVKRPLESLSNLDNLV
ncbi:hypothetical protein MFFC18_03350 [Mariniblastus fucicola]|uniref:Uncharacterized protein n=1 Tax=Mariniblastus fucicola TaxID=980251 RepID=A0A5B9P1V4_9BACT|nr:hypothetical protein MFFC18_03350 [Mariniblastus fucicola]